MSEATTIYDRLRAVQLELKAPKNETGRFGKSRSAEAILEAAKPVLERHKLTLVVSDEMIQIGDRHYVKATATVYAADNSSLSATAHAWEGEIDRGLDSSQVTGKTSSYARKYALGGLFAIDDTKDADTAPSAGAPPRSSKPAVGSSRAPQAPTKPAAPAQATGLQKSRITAFLRSQGVQDEDMGAVLHEDFGVADASKMTKVEAENVLSVLSAMQDGEEAA